MRRKQEPHPRTLILNKSQKNQSKKIRQDALLWLAATFPKAFDNSVRIHPLKIGIMEDILAYADHALKAQISKSKLREAVVLFTRRLDYLTCLKARELRIDLNGEVCGEVTLEEAQHAASKIKKRIEKSIRNARKSTTDSTETHPYEQYKKSAAHPTKPLPAAYEDYFPVYPTRPPLISDQLNKTPPPVLVKHKTTRQFDPDMVARLKEKLGISRNAEKEKKETTD